MTIAVSDLVKNDQAHRSTRSITRPRPPSRS